MLIILQFIYLIIYLALLILGAWCVSEGGDILGSKYDASILGGFVISWLNTLPETIFFITALENNRSNFAVGAISGSVIVVCTIAVGCCVWIGGIMSQKNKNSEENEEKTSDQISSQFSSQPVNSMSISAFDKFGSKRILLLQSVRQQALILLASCIVPLLTIIFGFNLIVGSLGLLGYTVFLLWSLFKSKTEEEPLEDEEDEEDKPAWKGFAFLMAGGVFIYAFSLPFIDTVVNIGQSLNIAPLALAFFFAPVASEAPEILESISLSRKGKTQNINIAFSNLVGGTVSKTTLLTGILSFYGSRRNFAWLSPSFTVSYILVIICAAYVGSFGISSNHEIKKGKNLIALFFLCSIVQFSIAYIFGSKGDEILKEILEN